MKVLSEEAIHCFSECYGPVDERAGAGDVRADLDEVLRVAVRGQEPSHLGRGPPLIGRRDRGREPGDRFEHVDARKVAGGRERT